LDFYSWFQKSKRRIPPTVYEASSDAIQGDQSIRLMATYKYLNNKSKFSWQSALLKDQLHYDSEQKNIHSKSISSSFVQKLDYQRSKVLGGDLDMKLEHRFEEVSSNAYTVHDPINYISISGKYRRSWFEKNTIITGFKTGSKDDQLSPFAPYFYYSYTINNDLKFLLSAGKKYRYPSFNDYFWSIGGNEDLKIERSFESEAGIFYSPGQTHQYELRAYCKKINDWILWLPVDGVFKANNIDRVKARGLEATVKSNYRINKINIHSRLFYNWNRIHRDMEEQKDLQMIYSPEHIIKHSFGARINNWNLDLNHSWSEKVYTTVDHSSYLPSIYLMNVAIEKKLELRNISISGWIKVNNVFNKQYFSIPNYVMPGRYFELGISLEN